MLTRCTPYETMNIMKTTCLSMIKVLCHRWLVIYYPTRLINDHTCEKRVYSTSIEFV